MEPKLLTDNSRLQEIYDLRVFAWENSELSRFVNQSLFPNGWSDKFDESSEHFIIEDEGKIVAAARISIVENVLEIDKNLMDFNLTDKPYILWSRLVVHPDFRAYGFTYLFDQVRLKKSKEIGKSKAITLADEKRIPALSRLGFYHVGNVSHYYGENNELDTSCLMILEL